MTRTDSVQNSPENTRLQPMADGLWMVRLQLEESEDHVNVYVLADEDGLTIVDTGICSSTVQQAWKSVLGDKQLHGRSISRVILTHHHPDHVGLAGWLCEQGAQLYATRTCWLSASLLLTQPDQPTEAAIQFMVRHGMSAIELAAYQRRLPGARFRRLVGAIPGQYSRLSQGDKLQLAGRQWNIEIGHGHAAEHATLWSDDGFAIVGDQILKGVSPSLTVHPTEPEADILGEWFASCQRLATLGNGGTLALPGHNQPFDRIGDRCRRLIHGHEAVVDRMLSHLAKPSSTVACAGLIPQPPHRALPIDQQIVRTVPYLNHLLAQKLLVRELFGNQYIWRRAN